MLQRASHMQTAKFKRVSRQREGSGCSREDPSEAYKINAETFPIKIRLGSLGSEVEWKGSAKYSMILIVT